MGFFSSRKIDDRNTDPFVATNGHDNDKSVVQVLRSKFYIKSKGKERDSEPPVSFYASMSTAETLSSSEPASRVPITHSRLAKAPRMVQDQSPVPSTSKKSFSSASSIPSPLPSSRYRPGSPSRWSEEPDISPLASKSRKLADNASLTLAQRLNELAVANSEGLLNDDEYRLLRQNLFQRFSVSTVVPSETPVVPVARSQSSHTTISSDKKPRPLSHVQVDVSRSGSIKSKRSVASGVASVFRLATNRRTPSGSKDFSETSSIVSSTSNFFKRNLSRKSSTSSIRTTTSRIHGDTVSPRTAKHERSATDRLLHHSPLGSRSNSSVRKMATPPSSFPSRIIHSDSPRYTAYSYSPGIDEDHPKSVAELKDEILAVEAEARRLMDAFHGLEMTTLSRVQRQVQIPDSPSVSINHDQRRTTIVDSDMMSTKSGTSAGTSLLTRRFRLAKGDVHGSPSSGVRRMNSISSFGSQERRAPGMNHSPTYGQVVESSSNSSLGRNGPVGEDDVMVEVEDEMEEIRRRRGEVGRRYEGRLDYLRAQLKGAQLHEKLLRR